jgi:hypothetical protein
MQGGQIVRPRRDMGRCETVQEQTTLDEDFSPGTNVVVGFNGHQLRNSERQPVPGFHLTNSQRFATFCYFWILLNAFQINVNVCFLPLREAFCLGSGKSNFFQAILFVLSDQWLGKQLIGQSICVCCEPNLGSYIPNWSMQRFMQRFGGSKNVNYCSVLWCFMHMGLGKS